MVYIACQKAKLIPGHSLTWEQLMAGLLLRVSMNQAVEARGGGSRGYVITEMLSRLMECEDSEKSEDFNL